MHEHPCTAMDAIGKTNMTLQNACGCLHRFNGISTCMHVMSSFVIDQENGCMPHSKETRNNTEHIRLQLQHFPCCGPARAAVLSLRESLHQRQNCRHHRGSKYVVNLRICKCCTCSMSCNIYELY